MRFHVAWSTAAASTRASAIPLTVAQVPRPHGRRSSPPHPRPPSSSAGLVGTDGNAVLSFQFRKTGDVSSHDGLFNEDDRCTCPGHSAQEFVGLRAGESSISIHDDGKRGRCLGNSCNACGIQLPVIGANLYLDSLESSILGMLCRFHAVPYVAHRYGDIGHELMRESPEERRQ